MTSNVVKIAVKNGLSSSGGADTRLLQFSRSANLDVFMKDLCRHWNLDSDYSEFALEFDANDEVVNEDNRHKIVDGTVLKLGPTSTLLSKSIVDSLLTKGVEKSSSSLEVLHGRLKSSKTFAQDFVDLQGLGCLVNLVKDTANLEFKGSTLMLACLRLLLIDFKRTLEQKDLDEMIDGIVTYIKSRHQNPDDARVSQGLAILRQLDTTQRHVDVEELLNLALASSDAGVQSQACILASQILEKMDTERTTVIRDVIVKTGPFLVSNCLPAREGLHCLQDWILSSYSIQMKATVDSLDNQAVAMIKELRKIAFENNANIMDDRSQTLQRNRFADDYRSLGFESTRDPTEDFRKPPGLLALTLMHGFATGNKDTFTRLVLESSCRGDDCPFAATSIALVTVFCQVLKIADPPQRGPFVPLVLNNKDFLEQMFAVCIQHLFKTWREMRATTKDLSKVLDVTREQMLTSLSKEPLTIDEFSAELLSYTQISESWKEATKARGDQKDCKAINELRQLVQPELLNLVQRQRLNFICEGTKFTRQKREGSKYIFAKLSSNHKTLYYGDWSDAATIPALENLDKKIAVCDIKDFTSGPASNEATGLRNRNQQDVEKFITIHAETDTLELIAPDSRTVDIWCDALNALMRRDMSSQKVGQDLDTLLSLEVRLRLLHVEGVELPNEQPQVPPLPPALA